MVNERKKIEKERKGKERRKEASPEAFGPSSKILNPPPVQYEFCVKLLTDREADIHTNKIHQRSRLAEILRQTLTFDHPITLKTYLLLSRLRPIPVCKV